MCLSVISTSRLRALERAETALLASRRVEGELREASESAQALLRVLLCGFLRETAEEQRAMLRAMRDPETQARLDRIAAHFAGQRTPRPDPA